jgi:1-aminocyclopropane-1-carboxylate deaminase/D-cysteine desulfhydrase-like pyridoxal-dependent ACC family enzyme
VKERNEVHKMFKVVMIVDDCEYTYGTYTDRDRANEIAMQVREERKIDTFVKEVE